MGTTNVGQASPERPQPAADPVLEHSRHELRWILLLWLGCFVWVIGYCSLFGYRTEGGEVQIVLGMPSWVLWGVLLPWLVATILSSVFALWGIANDPLVDDADDA